MSKQTILIAFCSVALFTSVAVAGDDGLNEVITSGGGQDATPLENFRLASGEHILGADAAMATWVPGINTRERPAIIQVALVSSGSKTRLVVSPERGRRSSLALSFRPDAVELTSITFAERPGSKLLVRVNGIAYGADAGGGTEAYLLKWDYRRNKLVVSKHYTGVDAPAWAVVE